MTGKAAIEPERMKTVRLARGQALGSSLTLSASQLDQLKRLATEAAGTEMLFSPDKRARFDTLARELNGLLELSKRFGRHPAAAMEKELRQGLARDAVLQTNEVDQIVRLAQQAHTQFFSEGAVTKAELLHERVVTVVEDKLIDNSTAREHLDAGANALWDERRVYRDAQLFQKYGAQLKTLTQFLVTRPWPRTFSALEKQALEKIRYLAVRSPDASNPEPKLVIHYAARDRVKRSVFESALKPELEKAGIKLGIETQLLRIPLAQDESPLGNVVRTVFAQYPELTKNLLGFRSYEREGKTQVLAFYRGDLFDAQNLRFELQQKIRARGYGTELTLSPIDVGRVAERVR